MKGLLYPYEHLLPACPIIMGKSVACEHLPLVRSLQKGTIMENMNVTLAATADAFTAEAENAAKTLNITAKTTLGEVLGMLGLTPGQKKPGKTPTPKALRISEEPVAKMYDCVIYRNGFAYYNNGSNHSVLWLPYCISFTYHFNPLRDAEKNTLNEKEDLPEGLLEATPWATVVTLIAEHRIEHHIDTNSGIGHAEVAEKNEEEETQNTEAEDVDKRCKAFLWMDEPLGVNPLDAYIRKETREEMLNALTDKQREVYILYHKYEYTVEEIARMLNCAISTISQHLNCARKRAKNVIEEI